MKNYIRLFYIDEEVGVKLTLDANDGIKSMKTLRSAIKEAEGDLVVMVDKFGETSEQARSAAKRVAELKDLIGDSKTLMEQFNPDKKFTAFAQSLNGVLGGFTALQGAMGLLGVESEDLQKQLLKVQSALALSQGLNQLGDAINSFKSLGQSIVNSLGKSGAIGAAIAGVIALGGYIYSLFKKTDQLKESQKEYNKAIAETTVQVSKLENAFKQAKLGVISKTEALKLYNDTIGKVAGSTNDLNTAERLTVENAAAYIKVQGLKAQVNYLLEKSAKISTQALIDQQKLARGEILPAAANAASFKIKESQQEADDLLKIVDSLNKQIDDVKFKVTTSGLGSAFGKGGKVDKKTKDKSEQKKANEEFGDALNDRNIIEGKFFDKSLEARRIYLAEQQKDDDARLAEEQKNFDEQYQAWVDLQERKKEVAISNATATANALGALADLFGQQTVAGKSLAIAQAVINTYLGATKALSQGGVFGIASAVSVIAFGLAQVKKILSVKVPGKGAGSTTTETGTSVQAPLQISPNVTNTQLNQQQLNQIGNATVRAFVVESDITHNQERIRRLNRAARLG